MDLYYIDYKYEELLYSLENSKKDLEGFINEPLYQWILRKDKDMARKVKQRMYDWFIAAV